MIARDKEGQPMGEFPRSRIVITGIGLTSPNGNTLNAFRESLLTSDAVVSLSMMISFSASLMYCDSGASRRTRELESADLQHLRRRGAVCTR